MGIPITDVARSKRERSRMGVSARHNGVRTARREDPGAVARASPWVEGGEEEGLRQSYRVAVQCAIAR